MKTPRSIAKLIEWQCSILKPRPALTPSQWGEEYRFLDRSATAEPGRMRFDRLPYQRGMIDAPLKPGVRKTTFVLASQTGKTEVLNTLTGFFIHYEPASMMLVGPSADFTNDWVDGKIDKMVEATPVLRRIVGKIDGKRRAGIRKGAKIYPGGVLFTASACSGKDLRGRSCRAVLLDEVDAYPEKIPKEGDPLTLAYKRSANFWNRVIVQASTPTDLESSRICRAYDEGNGQRWHVECPHCRESQWLKWAQVKWDEGKPETARYICEKCERPWTDQQRIYAVETGRWVAERPEITDHESFHLPGLYRIMGHSGNYIEAFVREYLTARKGGTESYRAWVNTFLAEGYVEEGEVITADPLFKRREEYSITKIPAGVIRIVAGIDTQDDRWEGEFVGYGLGEETWGLGRIITSSAPGTKAAAAELDTWLCTKFEHPSGDTMEVSRAFMDAGGHHQKDVYDYCRERSHLVSPSHGSTRRAAQPCSKPKKTVKGVRLYEVGTHALKNSIYSRLKLTESGPGYLHFPAEPIYDGSYFAQLTAEKRVSSYEKGVLISRWEKPNGVRNEALDCRVYAAAAYMSLGLSNRTLDEENDRLVKAVAEREPEPDEQQEPTMKKEKKKQGSSEKITKFDLEEMKVVHETPAEPKPEPIKLPSGIPAGSRWASAKKASWAGGKTHAPGGVWKPMLT